MIMLIMVNIGHNLGFIDDLSHDNKQKIEWHFFSRPDAITIPFDAEFAFTQ